MRESLKTPVLANHSILQIGARALSVASLLALSANVSSGDGAHAPVESIPAAQSFITEHSGVFGGETIEYRVRAGETFLRDRDGHPTGSIFSFDYIGLTSGDQRPVTFVWNGGPGSASLWLHMGTFGPHRVVVPDDGKHAGLPPYVTVEAPETILDITDLVFVDPIGTGFSRALGDVDPKTFWGLEEDAAAMSQFIKTWLRENNRWNAPRFLLGESFGTTRAALVAKKLEREHDLSVNGLIFISQALDYAGSSPYVRDNLISFVTYVPTMAATAWYHGKIDRNWQSFEAFIEASRNFAVDELLPGLFRGNTLDRSSFEELRDRLSDFTGLSTEYIEQTDLRVNGIRFAAELLRAEGRVLGLMDTRYEGIPLDRIAARPGFDAGSAAISSAFKSTLLSYIQSDLNVQWPREYLSPSDARLGEQWNWNRSGRESSAEPQWVNTARDLADVMEVNPQIQVFVGSGYHDLVTPFFDAEFTLQRHRLPAERIGFHYYEGGHMMYVQENSRLRLLEDIRRFYAGALKK